MVLIQIGGNNIVCNNYKTIFWKIFVLCWGKFIVIIVFSILAKIQTQETRYSLKQLL